MDMNKDNESIKRADDIIKYCSYNKDEFSNIIEQYIKLEEDIYGQRKSIKIIILITTAFAVATNIIIAIKNTNASEHTKFVNHSVAIIVFLILLVIELIMDINYFKNNKELRNIIRYIQNIRKTREAKKEADEKDKLERTINDLKKKVEEANRKIAENEKLIKILEQASQKKSSIVKVRKNDNKDSGIKKTKSKNKEQKSIKMKGNKQNSKRKKQAITKRKNK